MLGMNKNKCFVYIMLPMLFYLFSLYTFGEENKIQSEKNPIFQKEKLIYFDKPSSITQEKDIQTSITKNTSEIFQTNIQTSITTRSLNLANAKNDENDENWITIQGELKYKDIYVGTGKIPKKTDKITAHLVGTFEDGTEFFNTKKTKMPFSFYYQMGDVISGIEMGIANMREFGKRKIRIPPEFGYGEKGFKDDSIDIKPNSIIYFEISIISVRDPQLDKINYFK